MRINQKLSTFVRLLTLSLIFAVVNGCDTFYWDANNKTELIGKKLSLKVALLSNSPLTHFKTSVRPSSSMTTIEWGLEYELVTSLAHEFDLQLIIVPVQSIKELEQKLADFQVDLGAGRITGNAKTNLAVGPSYQDTKLSLLCSKDQQHQPKDNVQEIFLLPSNDSLILRHDLASAFPRARISLGQDAQATLSRVSQNQSTCAIMEDLEAKFYLRIFPELSVHQTVSSIVPVHFITQKKNLKVQKMLYLWNQKISQTGALHRIIEKYSVVTNSLSQTDGQHFLDSIETDFKQFENIFKEAAHETQIPWQLLAAVSFQESNWQESAVSATGVKGLMMITKETADHLGIEDRTDPEQSIWGGARYLQKIFKSQPKSLSLRERWALTLATYNVGAGHLRDAQRLAADLGKNPYSWKDLRSTLPFLANPKYLSQLEFGAARGQEPVEFTERVLAYLDLMLTIQQ